MPDEKIDQKRPAHAENELHKMQQRLVDDTVDDSFPASDPPAWTTTGSKSVAGQLNEGETSSRQEGGNGNRGGRSSSRQDGGRGGSGWSGTAQRTMDQAGRYAQEAYRRGGEYFEQGRRYLPDMERTTRTISRPIGEYPLAAVLAAAALGYGIAWLIHGRSAQGHAHRSWSRAYGEAYDRDEHDDYEDFGRPVRYGNGDSPKPHGDKLPNTVKISPDVNDRY